MKKEIYSEPEYEVKEIKAEDVLTGSKDEDDLNSYDDYNG